MIKYSNLDSKMEFKNHFKNRVISKSRTSKGSFFGTWIKGAIFVFLIAQLSMTTSCNKEEIIIHSEESFNQYVLQGDLKNDESKWWLPILEKHNIKLGAYNNFGNVFEMGMEGNSINNGICTLKAATVLIKDRDNYLLIKADMIYHNFEKGVFDIVSGEGKVYQMDSELSKPSVTLTDLSKLTVVKEEAGVKYQLKGKAIVNF